MSSYKLLLIIILLFCYLIWSVFIINKIYKPNHFTKGQKLINSILVLMVPIVYGIILLSILKPSYQGTSSPEYRKNKGKPKVKPSAAELF